MRINRGSQNGRPTGHDLNPNPCAMRENAQAPDKIRPRKRGPMKDIIPCPRCHGTSQEPEAPPAIVDDFGTCLVCCNPLHARYAAHQGYVVSSLGPGRRGRRRKETKRES